MSPLALLHISSLVVHLVLEGSMSHQESETAAEEPHYCTAAVVAGAEAGAASVSASVSVSVSVDIHLVVPAA